MSDSKPNVFSALKQGRGEAPASPGAEVITLPKTEYKALDLDAPRSRVTRLRVNFSDGSASLFSYAYLVEVLTTSPQFVSLIFTSTVITLQGRNLSGLLDALQEERVLALNPFDEKRHMAMSPDDDAPYIERIERDTGEEEE